tara:strand:- start:124 stop:1125 length:1002 start_codon:yes stop_codon:yes gene_type:complete
MIFNFSDRKLEEDHIHSSIYRDLAHIDIDNAMGDNQYSVQKDPDSSPKTSDGKKKIILCTRLDWETNCGNLVNCFDFMNGHENDCKFILITYGSYISPPQRFIDNMPASMHKWYAVNAETDHERIIGIPLGIAKPIWENGQIRSAIIENTSDTKEDLLYINHNVRTDERTPRRGIRKSIYDRFESEQGDWFTIKEPSGGCNFYGVDASEISNSVQERGDRIFKDGEKEVSQSTKDFIREMSSHKFVLSPSGMGLETMRTWEALYSRTIPVIQRCKSLDRFSDLPVLYTDDYSEISEDYLNRVYEEYSSREWDLSKMFFSYWKDLIMEDYEGMD